MKYAKLLALFAAAMVILAGGPALAQKQITIALGSEPTTLDPQLREDGGERAVTDNIYETIMVRTPQGKSPTPAWPPQTPN